MTTRAVVDKTFIYSAVKPTFSCFELEHCLLWDDISEMRASVCQYMSLLYGVNCYTEEGVTQLLGDCLLGCGAA
jgi:hypothetical protein